MSPIAKRAPRAAILEFLAAPPSTMPSLVVLHGKEHILADAAIASVVACAIPDPSVRDLNVDTLDGSSTRSSGDIIGRVSALPFLAERRVVIVRATIDL